MTGGGKAITLTGTLLFEHHDETRSECEIRVEAFVFGDDPDLPDSDSQVSGQAPDGVDVVVRHLREALTAGLEWVD